MKRLTTLVVLLGMALALSAQTKPRSGESPIPTVVRPLTDDYDYNDDHTFPVYTAAEPENTGGHRISRSTKLRMKRTKDATYLTFVHSDSRDWVFYMEPKNSYIRDAKTGTIYQALYTEDYPLGYFYWMVGSATRYTSTTTVYPPLPDSVKVIDYVEPPTPSRRWWSGRGFTVSNLSVEMLCSY